MPDHLGNMVTPFACCWLCAVGVTAMNSAGRSPRESVPIITLSHLEIGIHDVTEIETEAQLAFQRND